MLQRYVEQFSRFYMKKIYYVYRDYSSSCFPICTSNRRDLVGIAFHIYSPGDLWHFDVPAPKIPSGRHRQDSYLNRTWAYAALFVVLRAVESFRTFVAPFGAINSWHR